MTPEQREAWRIVLGHVLELLEGNDVSQGLPSAQAADLTVADLATRFGRSASTVRAWCEAGRFPGAYRFEHREWRVPAAGLAAFEADQRSGVSQPARRPAQGRGKLTDLGAWRKTS